MAVANGCHPVAQRQGSLDRATRSALIDHGDNLGIEEGSHMTIRDGHVFVGDDEIAVGERQTQEGLEARIATARATMGAHASPARPWAPIWSAPCAPAGAAR